MWLFVLIGVGVTRLAPVSIVLLMSAFKSEPLWKSLDDTETAIASLVRLRFTSTMRKVQETWLPIRPRKDGEKK